jgi:DNA polymerase III subunit delta
VLYLLSGREDFLREDYLGQLKTLMRRLPLGEHNIDELRPPSTVRDVIALCEQTPFLCEKRMVIARGILAPVSRGASRRRGQSNGDAAPTGEVAELAEYVKRLPASTHLVLVEDDPSLLQLFAGVDPKAVRKDFPRLRDDAVPAWIMQRARQKGADISRGAASALAQLVGSELRALDTEIDKLATSVAADATIEAEDVEELVSGAGAGIFAFHDALAERRPAAALATLRSLLGGGMDPTELYAQIVALVRRLLVVKELTAERKPLTQNAPALGLSSSPFVLEKLQRQVARIPISDLEWAYRLLRDTDVSVKTGRIEAELALDLVVAELVGLLTREEARRSV